MISAKKLIKLAKRWQKMASIRRKRITLPRTTRDSETNGCSTSLVVDKGHFVVYSVDQKRFVLPLEYLKNSIMMELFNMAEEEFGLPSNGILLMPCDANFMEYVIALIKKKPSEELEKALIMSLVSLNAFIRITRKWQKTASIGKKRVASARANKNMAAANHSNKSSEVDKGCFAIHTMDKRHLVIQDV
ncbi:hypothetical protein V6N13_090113 [Hibiscus sabdariffa]